MERVTIHFDLDGTIADLYGYPEWLPQLKAERTEPFTNCNPLLNPDRIRYIIAELRANGHKVVVNSWTPKGASDTYHEAVIIAKMEWLERHGLHFDDMFFLRFGENKSHAKTSPRDILIDDNAEVREEWGRLAYDPTPFFKLFF